jgi:predicted SnoaL-like aldol condensation-catalyzing enzyme
LTDRNLIVDKNQVALQATFVNQANEQPVVEATLVEVFRLVDGKAAELWNILRWN